MTKVVLIRHGRSTANADGVLAGRAEGVGLDEVGRAQAAALRRSLDGVPVAGAYTSPLQRCRETAALAGFPDAEPVEELTECGYGAWTGRALAELAAEPAWAEIQARPSSVTFPGGEAMAEMARRSVGAVADLASRHDGVVLVFSHGDPIKAILADALAVGFDDFQRLHVNPGGVSVIELTPARTMVLAMNVGGDLAGLLGASVAPTVGGGDVAGVG
ncbi:MAG: MSMEG_4193 family putative phosphomutase [Tessaracoccus sp.]|uniref:MSMEG_4193 family putative phosphomutase n=1 Tax=Tessaracoccus sp. TaxID=1971211 RepID=UPI001ECA1D40|nr:MSMEG_4193 family putative phosphomutase [Tessaracoccus sp.]MBK7821502.1 MSMEG_4193 family putative phosphomutase [Tessaracoccus sp.]